jgi:hypothetical protein
MTGKVIDNSSAVGLLILIVPYAIAAVILYTFWQWILLLLVLSLGWKLWQNYQWLQLSARVSPLFNRLIQENQGCLTAFDLSHKADLSAAKAKSFLEKKAEEYGAQKRTLADRGTVYYFLTVNALGSIFDDSEPEDEDKAIAEPNPAVSQPTAAVINTEVKAEAVAATAEEETIDRAKTTLTQIDLAKRLDTHTSTISRRKNDPDFVDWSRSKDPEGMGWKFVSKSNSFVAID